MRIPDVSGYKLENALELMKAEGIEEVAVKLTAPPRLREAGYDGSSRVVRQSIPDDGVPELLVCNVNAI